MTAIRPGRAFRRAVLVLIAVAVSGAASLLYAQRGHPTSVTSATRASSAPLRIDILVDSATLGSNGVALAEITFPPGSPAAPHRHGALEMLYIIDGELEHVVNGNTQRLGPGMVGIVHQGDTVSHRVASATPVRALVIWVPGTEASRMLRARGGGAPVAIASVAERIEGVRRLRETWTAAYDAGDIDRMRDLYAPDAVRMPYDAPAQAGRDSVLAAYATSFAARAFTPAITLTPAQVELHGDLAIERGTYDERLTPKRGGQPLREVGKYVSTARLGADGVWRFEWSIFNRDRRPGG